MSHTSPSPGVRPVHITRCQMSDKDHQDDRGEKGERCSLQPSQPPPSRASLVTSAPEVIFLVLSLLSLDDILHLSQTCSRFYQLLNQVTHLIENIPHHNFVYLKAEEVWRTKMSASNLVVTDHIKRIAHHLLNSGQFPSCIADTKLCYLIIKRHHRKWVTGDFSVMNVEASAYQKMNDDHIASLLGTPGRPLSGPDGYCHIYVFDRIGGTNLGICR